MDIEIITKSINYIVIICLILIMLIRVYQQIQINIKNNKIIKYNFRKKQRNKLNKKARENYTLKKLNNSIDPEMISNKPLTYEEAGNLKYKQYINAQWEEINKL